ncbi:DUF4245 family protein [Glycomyces sp. NPDC046736]|uniref:DUF4245 family protein n=1 Tax=Glycomyces sp. NPDC046736 TaxID=3155615 RepID=UPI003404211E
MSTDEVKVEAAADAESQGEAPAPTRPKPRRMRDMALSMAVLLVPIGLFYWGWSWIASDRQVSEVDTTENAATAASLGLEVIEPELSEDWKPISTHLAVGEDTVTLRTGWYSPDGDGLQLVQTNGPAEDANDAIDGPGEPLEAAGISWAAYEFAGGEAWVADIGTTTVILTADNDGLDQLEGLAEGVAAATG